MIAALLPVSALLLSVAMLLMGNGLQTTLLPLRAQTEAFGSVEIGVLGSAYFVGFALGCWRGAMVIRQAGHVKAFAAIVAIASTSALLHSLITDPVFWWVIRLLSGACIAMLFMIIESWLNESATNETRGTVFSIYTAINLSMISIGQVIITLGDPAGFPLFLIASILLSLAAVPVALSRAATPQPIEKVGVRIGYLLKLSPVGFLGCFAVGATNGAFWSLAPIVAQIEGAAATRSAIFIAVSVIAGAMAQYPLGKLSDSMDRRRVIIGVAVGGAIAGAALFFAIGHTETILLAAGFLFGAFAFPLYSLCVAHANDFVDNKSFVEAAGGLLLTWAAGAVIGPLAASALMSSIGPKGLFVFTAAIHLVLAGFVIFRMRRRDIVPEETKGTFNDAINASYTLTPIDFEAGQQAATPATEPQAPERTTV